MSADKYSCIFSRQMATIVYLESIKSFRLRAIGLNVSRDRIFPNFQTFARCEKDLKDSKHNSLHFGRKYARMFVLGHYMFLEAHSFLQLRSRKTVRFSEQIMFADKYSCIFSRQMAAIVYL